MELHVADLSHSDIADYCTLIREVYDEFIAASSNEEGNNTFYDFITEEAVHERMHSGALTISARVGGEIVGACSFRDTNHLSIFFVKREYQNRGIGRMMFAYSLRKIRMNNPETDIISVNSSPYALGACKRLGFVQTAERQQKDGIVYYPMAYEIVVR